MTDHDAGHVPVDAEAVATVVGLMRDMPICLLTTIGTDGSLRSRPMTVQEVEATGDAWMFASATTEVVEDLAVDDRVNLGFSSSDAWVSLAGRVEVVTDEVRTRDLWNTAAEAWFPDGPTDPDLRLLHVRAASAQYWDTPGRAATLVAMVRARLTDEQADVGDVGEVDLPD